jgi:seryl-tRNA synthetase
MKYHFDMKSIRSDPMAFDEAMARRGHVSNVDHILSYDGHRRNALARVQDIRNQIKARSQEIGAAIKAGDKAKADDLKRTVKILKDNEASWDEQAVHCEGVLEGFLLQCPNIAAKDVPDGKDETSNVELKRWGGPGARDGEPHWDMEQVDLGFETAVKISGTRFSMMSGPVARLHRALGQFMLDRHILRGFREVIPPVIVKEQALFGTGQLPKFGGDLFAIADDDYDANEPTQFLIPTAEVSLTNIHADSIVMDMHRYVALTDCFRSEAGSAGRDTRGLIRQHQFQKVELVSICEPQQSVSEHEYMTQSAEAILEALKLPYRRMLLCAGDMGFSAQKTFDLEVWLPGQNTYREISSISNCGDFQARRMNTRYKVGGETVYAHTLNGSGLAVGRTLVAVLENYQTSDDVMIPEVLRPYMLGCHYLSQLEDIKSIA